MKEINISKKDFVNILEAVKRVDDVTRVDIKEGKLEIVTVDTAHVELVKIDYRMDTQEEIKIGLNVDKTLTMLKTIKEDTLNLKIGKKLWINDKIGIGLLDVAGMEKKKIPSLTYGVQTEDLDLSQIKRIIETGMAISDYAEFIAEKGEFTVEIEGETDIIRYPIGKVIKGEGKANFSLDYLNSLLKDAEKGKVYFSTDAPLKIEYKKGEVSIEYLLAPRITAE